MKFESEGTWSVIRDMFIIQMLIGVTILLGIFIFFSGCSVLQKKNPDIKEWTESCTKMSFDSTIVACSYKKVDMPKYAILYMHGLLEDETVFRKSFFAQDSLQALMNANPDAMLVIVSFQGLASLSYSWTLTPNSPRAQDPRAATVPTFVGKVMHELHLPKTVNLVGLSMGGANTATLCETNPELFSSCSLLHPMLTQCAYTNAAASDCPAKLEIEFNFSKSEWAKGNPFVLLGKKMPKVMIETCRNDQFNLYAPEIAWKDLVSKTQEITWVDDPEGCSHYSWNWQSVDRNLVKE